MFEKPILLIFFTRSDTFAKVFEEVKKIKPKKLYLAQDGPRNDKDMEGILKCREIAQSVDWDCEVHKNYSEKNMGCGLRPQSAISWVLSQEENVVILEDDCVPCQSFFDFTSEMLDRYREDNRICMISGLNHFETWKDSTSDYFFCKSGAIWGWATWKRAWAQYDYQLTQLKHADVGNLKKAIANDRVAKKRISLWQQTVKKLEEGVNISYWDVQWGIVRFLQNQLVIVPSKNLISNIGAGSGSTHAIGNENTFQKGRNFFAIPQHTYSLPFAQPESMLCDYEYDDKVYDICYPSVWKKYWNIIKGKFTK